MSQFKKATRTFKILFYLFITPTLNSEAIPLEINSIGELESLVKCVVAAIKTERKPTVTIIGDDTKNTVYENIHNKESLTKVLSEEYVPQIIFNKLQILNESASKFEENTMLVVIFVDNCKILEQLDVIVIDKKIKYVIILYEYEDCNMDLEKIGWTLQHYDATFISQSKNHTIYQFQTTFPDIDESSCDYYVKIKLNVVNTCFNGTLDKSVIFPAKETNNLKGCPFHVGMATLYPYSIIENKESLRNLQQINESQIRGSDLEIIKIFCNNINASLNMYYIYREEENPYLHTEFISYLLNGSLDACAGGLYNVYGDSITYSGAYNMQAVIWAYQVEREPRSWRTIIGPPQTLKTNDEVMGSGRTPYLNFETKFFVEDAKYIAFAKTSLNCSGFEDCENKTVSNKGSTVLIEGYFYSLQAFTAVKNEARVLRASENILFIYYYMIIRSNSHFVRKFKKTIAKLFEAGICDRLYLEVIGLLTVAKAKSTNENIMANSYLCESGCAITITQIAGAIYVWIVGCTLSFILFVIEIMVYKEQHKMQSPLSET
ncbi:unnamed protein product [Parnassius apollo]|uniref:(apollo) hypothetical protein n=1 Tax=Parnassius apollo TaxID=110799 RepID=A0A8S3WZ68_PARAO|nr:unnamed protein product [Parnassius apollo]